MSDHSSWCLRGRNTYTIKDNSEPNTLRALVRTMPRKNASSAVGGANRDFQKQYRQSDEKERDEVRYKKAEDRNCCRQSRETVAGFRDQRRRPWHRERIVPETRKHRVHQNLSSRLERGSQRPFWRHSCCRRSTLIQVRRQRGESTAGRTNSTKEKMQVVTKPRGGYGK